MLNLRPMLLMLPTRAVCLCSFSSSAGLNYTPWSGLQSWRRSPLNEDRFWGPNGPQSLQKTSPPQGSSIAGAPSLAEMGALVLSTPDPILKAELSHLAFSRWHNQKLPVGVSTAPAHPARPPKPELISPKEIPSPKDSPLPLNAYMLHNLAHVELNAIDLAWDTVVRFSPFAEILGEEFFADFAHVADDESRHFGWCSQRLSELGFKYGDMPAHNLLWRECQKTADNVAARLAAIPLVQEARGLDAGPRLVQKLVGFGDVRSSKIVGQIAEEEVAHVAVGVDWFISICRRLGRPPSSTFKGENLLLEIGSDLMPDDPIQKTYVELAAELLKEYNVELKGPFNYSARDIAGIPREWYGNFVDRGKEEQLSAVYDRLASIIEMESKNSSLSGSS